MSVIYILYIELGRLGEHSADPYEGNFIKGVSENMVVQSNVLPIHDLWIYEFCAGLCVRLD